MLIRVWEELYYHIDVLVVGGGHNEQLNEQGIKDDCE